MHLAYSNLLIAEFKEGAVAEIWMGLNLLRSDLDIFSWTKEQEPLESL